MKIWRVVPSGSGSYSRQAGGWAGRRGQAHEIWARVEILKVCYRLKFDFLLCLAKVLNCFSKLMHFSDKHCYKVVLYSVIV